MWCPRSVCKRLVSVYHRECPHSAPENIKHNDVSSTQNVRTRTSAQLLAMCCGFISGRARIHLTSPEGCLDDSSVMPQIRMQVVSQRIPERMPPFRSTKYQISGVSSTQNARNDTSRAAAGDVLQARFRSSQDTPKAPSRVFGRLKCDVRGPYVRG